MEKKISQTLTPKDVLNIFIEQHRLCSPLDPEADPNIELSFDSSIADWRNANDLLPWKKLSIFLNEEFNISATEKEWYSVLKPSTERTLKDVCELISKQSTHQDIKPVNLFGQECLSSAVFLTLKKYLKRRRVDVTDLRPSSLLTPYLDKYFSELLEQTTIISNGKKVIDNIDIKRKKTGILSFINIFDEDRFSISTGDIKTFRDLTLKIIEVNEQSY